MTLKKILSNMFICMFLYSPTTFADESAVINYQGQPQEVIKLSKKVITPTEVQEPYQDTCSRQVPDGTTRPVCEDVVVGHDRQCRDIPPQRRCETRYNTQCQDVTRSRRECSPGRTERICSREPVRQVCSDGPTRQECSTGPSRQECSPGPSREVCTNSPTREVCSESPTREVCSNNPRTGERVCRQVGGERTCRQVGGERSCRTVPGENVCRTIPGERVCRNVPGPRVCNDVGGNEVCRNVQGPDICRDVPYTERVCSDVPYEHCYMTAPDQVCTDVPRYENQCVDVPNMRTEQYACTKYRTVIKNVETQVNHDLTIDFESNIDLDIKFKITLEDDGTPKIVSDAKKDNLVIYFNNVKETEANGSETSLDLISHIKISILEVKAAVGMTDLSKLALNSILLHRSNSSVDFGLSKEIDKTMVSLYIVRGNGDELITMSEQMSNLMAQGIVKKRKLGAGFVYTFLLENRMNYDFKKLGRYDVSLELKQASNSVNLPKGTYIYKNVVSVEPQQKLIEKRNLSTAK